MSVKADVREAERETKFLGRFPGLQAVGRLFEEGKRSRSLLTGLWHHVPSPENICLACSAEGKPQQDRGGPRVWRWIRLWSL